MSKAVKPCCSTFIDHPAAHTFCFASAHAGFTVLLTPVQVSEKLWGFMAKSTFPADLSGTGPASPGSPQPVEFTAYLELHWQSSQCISHPHPPHLHGTSTTAGAVSDAELLEF